MSKKINYILPVLLASAALMPTAILNAENNKYETIQTQSSAPALTDNNFTLDIDLSQRSGSKEYNGEFKQLFTASRKYSSSSSSEYEWVFGERTADYSASPVTFKWNIDDNNNLNIWYEGVSISDFTDKKLFGDMDSEFNVSESTKGYAFLVPQELSNEEAVVVAQQMSTSKNSYSSSEKSSASGFYLLKSKDDPINFNHVKNGNYKLVLQMGNDSDRPTYDKQASTPIILNLNITNANENLKQNFYLNQKNESSIYLKSKKTKNDYVFPDEDYNETYDGKNKSNLWSESLFTSFEFSKSDKLKTEIQFFNAMNGWDEILQINIFSNSRYLGDMDDYSIFESLESEYNFSESLNTMATFEVSVDLIADEITKFNDGTYDEYKEIFNYIPDDFEIKSPTDFFVAILEPWMNYRIYEDISSYAKENVGYWSDYDSTWTELTESIDFYSKNFIHVAWDYDADTAYCRLLNYDVDNGKITVQIPLSISPGRSALSDYYFGNRAHNIVYANYNNQGGFAKIIRENIEENFNTNVHDQMNKNLMYLSFVSNGLAGEENNVYTDWTIMDSEENSNFISDNQWVMLSVFILSLIILILIIVFFILKNKKENDNIKIIGGDK